MVPGLFYSSCGYFIVIIYRSTHFSRKYLIFFTLYLKILFLKHFLLFFE
jgi:hypothetical protein